MVSCRFILVPLVLLSLVVASGCRQSSPIAEQGAASGNAPSVAVQTNPNVETLGLLLALAFDGYGEGTLPVAHRARIDLAPYRERPVVRDSRELVQNLGIDGYTILALRAEPFGGPNAGGLRAALPTRLAEGAGGGDAAAGQQRIHEYLRRVAAFYREADVERLLDAHRARYARAEAEVTMMAPDASVIAAMERYFGERLRSYTIVPTLTHLPYGNVGTAIDCDDPVGSPGVSCRDAVFVMGAHVSVPDAAFEDGTAAGFYDETAPEESRQRTTDLILHEFGHAFVNPYLEAPAVWAAMAGHEDLMIDPLRARMAPQAYTAWTAVAVEHVVRTTEVRVALSAGDDARAERLRRTYLEDRAFIYLPWLETAAERYERLGPAGSGRYATFGAFVPEMVQAFGTVDRDAAHAHLGLGGGPLRRVTIRVTGTVPPGDTVFVTGGHTALANWNPHGVPLRPEADGAWFETIEVEAGTRLEYKATRGSWATEAADATGRPLPNASVFVRSDTTITLAVARWLDEG